MLGWNGVVGTGAALDGPEALNGAIAQGESAGVIIDAGVLKSIAGRSETLRWRLCIRSVLLLPKHRTLQR